MDDQHFFCHKCGYVGPVNCIRGVAKCAYCNSINVTLTDAPVSIPPWYSGLKRDEPLRASHARARAGQE